jgi:hypothetical protein
MDIVERQHYERMREHLRVMAERIHPDYGPCDGFDGGACHECLATFERLRQRVEELEAALRPFAQAARGPGQRVTDRYPKPNDFRVALSLLEDTDD